MNTETTTRSAGQRAYEAYFMARDGDAGCWDDLTDEQRACWEAAGEAVTEQGSDTGTIPRLPDPLPGELAGHVELDHGYPAGLAMVAAAQAHTLAHVRGVFAGGIHFHETTGG